jgi:hypothetical protein
MPDAKVTNITALDEFRAALANFAVDVHRAIADLEMESQRAVEWFTHDRPKHWETEVRGSQDAVARAKDDLANCKTYKRVGDYVPSCDQEKKALELAKRRLEHAERKLQVVKRWTRAVEQAVDKFRGPIQQLAMVLDGDIPRAMTLLERMTIALESYAANSAPLAVKWEELVAAGEDRSMARSNDEADKAEPIHSSADGTESEQEAQSTGSQTK